VIGIWQEKASGTTTEGRAELKTVLYFLRKGAVLVVTRPTSWPLYAADGAIFESACREVCG
jgi:hypothetical protein